MRAEDSSSASANQAFVVRKTEWASAGILRIHTAEGPSFLVREEALDRRGLALPESGERLEGSAAESLYAAARAFLAERAGLAYLSRAEHSRYQLSLKLAKKGYSRVEADEALDVLADAGYLDDARFASAWIRNRLIGRSEGRALLLAGLSARGVDRSVADRALEEQFRDDDERALCLRAMAKLARLGRTGERMRISLQRKGFSKKLISECLKNGEN